MAMLTKTMCSNRLCWRFVPVRLVRVRWWCAVKRFQSSSWRLLDKASRPRALCSFLGMSFVTQTVLKDQEESIALVRSRALYILRLYRPRIDIQPIPSPDESGSHQKSSGNLISLGSQLAWEISTSLYPLHTSSFNKT